MSDIPKGDLITQCAQDGIESNIVSQTPTGFLKLPMEIRLNIYKRAFLTVSTVHNPFTNFSIKRTNIVDCTDKLFAPNQVLPHYVRNILDGSAESIKDSLPRLRTGGCPGCGGPRNMKHYCWRCLNGPSALLLTNRQVYVESLPYAYERRRFSFIHSDDLLTFITAVESHGHGYLVKRIELVVRVQTLGSTDHSLHQLFKNMKLGALHDVLPNLKRVTVTYDCPDYPQDHPASTFHYKIVGQIAANVMRGLQGYGEDLQVRVRGLEDLWDWESLIMQDPAVGDLYQGEPRFNMNSDQFRGMLWLVGKHVDAPGTPSVEWSTVRSEEEPDEAVKLIV